MIPGPFSYHRPATLAEAVNLLSTLGDEARPLAGGHSLVPMMKLRLASPEHLVDLHGVAGLKGIRRDGNTIVIGAMTTQHELLTSEDIGKSLPILHETALLIADPQVRYRGTIGGNVANGSPAGDSLPVLAAADAVVVLRSVDSERRVPLTAFYTGYRTSVMRADELIVAIEVPRVVGAQWFRKVGTRAAQAISKVVVAAVRGGTSPRIAVGSIAPTVVRLNATERALAAGTPLDDAMGTLRAEVRPIDDLRSTADYRKRVTENLVRRFWSETA